MSAEDQKCVFLWAVSGSLSTAVTKCMSFVDGVQIWHEPYQYMYHKEKFMALATSTNKNEQSIFQIIQKHSGNFTQVEESPKGKLIDEALFEYQWLKEQLETEDKDKKLIFVKEMSYLVRGKYDFLPTERKYRHTFLIREPHRVYKSIYKMLTSNIPEEFKAGLDLRTFPLYDAHRVFEYNYDLWKYVKENLDSEPIIIDATELAANPEKLLPKYFKALGIPWKEKYLTWDASSDVTTEWKASYQSFIRAKHAGTHKAALASTRFNPDTKELPSRDDMTEDVIESIDAAMPFYTEMYEQRLKP